MSHILPTATLGRTGLEVTRLGFGAGHRRAMTDAEMNAQLNAVLDAGINFIDTANDYGNSEEMIGRYLRHRRDEFVLATKCGCHPDGHIWSRENAFRGLHESLERLRVDCVDLMQLHNPTVAQCEQGELVQALQDMRAQGKVRWIGISTTLPHLPTYLEWDVFDAYQIPYSALERDHENWLTTTARAGAGNIIRGGVALGKPGVGLGQSDRWQAFNEAGLDELKQAGESDTSFVLRYTLTHPDVHTNIVGTTNPAHLAENAQATLAGPLSQDVYDEARKRLDRIGVSPA
ncbi:MAG: aldo/keto reductase [Caldilineaceae bacterium SB0670_bin_27]|uniref:Aldo/keto reductase n=1 Tax=Caldilineaceae bacterium SB0664_bin_27 TaxID=2605260 RepID=A0A6B0YVI8_9CHLR|nr:aldo/keto reductase [Caldilineaceae bacterium SB0664_bin_27]MYJ76580.1 aldo/keto reductase [Caldilineaceae bacterium SB0670_bin_27]